MRFTPLFIVILQCCMSPTFVGDARATTLANPPFYREKIWVGSGAARKVVRFPAPTDYEVVFNVDWDVYPYDRQRGAQTLDNESSCRLLFKPLIKNSKDIGRSLSVQLVRSFKDRLIGEFISCDISYPFKEVVDRQKRRKAGESEGKAHPSVLDMEKILSQRDITVLGIFEDTPVSLGVTSTTNIADKASPGNAKVKRVYAIMMMPMGGGLIHLYADADYHSDADRQWAENAVRAWRKAILKANPTQESPENDPSFFKEVAIFPFMGGILGTVVSIFVILFQRVQKHQNAPSLLTEPSNTRSSPPSAER